MVLSDILFIDGISHLLLFWLGNLNESFWRLNAVTYFRAVLSDYSQAGRREWEYREDLRWEKAGLNKG